MTEQHSGEAPLFRAPTALFLGDFNVGKSTLINALLRREVLSVTREESRALTTFVACSGQREAHYVALLPGEALVEPKSHEEFLSIRRDENNEEGYRALAASLPMSLFHHLVLVDTAGISSDLFDSAEIAGLADQENALLIVVADIEYWSAKHTMDFIAHHHHIFDGAMIVVANKTDHLNAHEVRRICDKAPKRMEKYGISPAPRFYALSARLEGARVDHVNEYRQRTKVAVREWCDASFDALRVALYEFEAARTQEASYPSFEDLLTAPLATSFIKTQQGASE